jgi:hypothetical protein
MEFGQVIAEAKFHIWKGPYIRLLKP